MNTAAQAKTAARQKRRIILPLLLLLLFLMLATSCIVGFLLGRTTDPGRSGALIDTIVLTPADQPEPPADNTQTGELTERISIVGVVHYTNGTPFSQGSVELHSEPRYARLSETGHFRFDEVEPGEHELSVLDPAGNVLAGRTIRVVRDAASDAYIDYEAMVCVLHIKVVTVEVDVELTLDGDGGLDVELRGTREADEAAASPGTTPAEPPGAKPGEQTTDKPGEQPTEQPTDKPMDKPGDKPDDKPTDKPAPAPDDGGADDGGGGGGGSGTDPDPKPPTPPDTDPGTVEVSRSDDRASWQTWTQQAEIDLFRPLDGYGERLIAPGSEGYYLFRVKNGRSRAIKFTLGIKEGDFHIPLEYRLATDELTPRGLTDWQTAALDSETVSSAVQLAASGERRYRIEWRWPFDGNDVVDTALGSRDGRIYTLHLNIRVEDAV